MGGVVATNTNDDVSLFFFLFFFFLSFFPAVVFRYYCRHQVQPLRYVMWMLVVEAPLGLRSLSFAYLVGFPFKAWGVGRTVVVTIFFPLPAIV